MYVLVYWSSSTEQVCFIARYMYMYTYMYMFVYMLYM